MDVIDDSKLTKFTLTNMIDLTRETLNKKYAEDNRLIIEISALETYLDKLLSMLHEKEDEELEELK